MTSQLDISSGYRFSGDIELRTLIFVDSSGKTLDISQISVEVNIYQDLNEHYIQCDVVIEDSIKIFNIVENGFTGGEMLIVSYRNRTSEDDVPFVNHIFGIYELSDRFSRGRSNETYIMKCVSVEGYASIPRRVNKTYGKGSSKTISSMIESLYREFIGNQTIESIYQSVSQSLNYTISKELDIEPTTNRINLIVPNLPVDETVDFFINEADSDDHMPLFVFYEDSSGFNFKNISTLISGEPVAEYVYLESNIDSATDHVGKEKNWDAYKMMEYRVISQTNILDNVKSGLYKIRTIAVDMLKKRKTEIVYDYTKESGKFTTLTGSIIPGAVGNEAPVDILITTRTNHTPSDSTFGVENHTPKVVDVVAAKRMAYKKIISNMVLEVTIPGNSKVNVGNTITLNFPIINDIEDTRYELDKYLSGKYLISKLRHKINGDGNTGFITVLECIRERGA